MSPYAQAYVVAARRTAFGRLGGLHRLRRVDELAGGAIAAALDDSKLSPRDVEAIVLGNASEGGNPARLAGLAAGLSDTAAALTIDRQCASGLDAILAGVRLVALGEAAIVVAGGAESLSNAPWRMSRPRSPMHRPRILETGASLQEADLEAAEVTAASAGIDQRQQDDFAAAARRSAAAALLSGRLAREIAVFGRAASETRDEAPQGAEKGLDSQAFGGEGRTLTLANTSQPSDGAAVAIIVDAATWARLGRPPALQLVATAAVGARPGSEVTAPLDAVRLLRLRAAGAGLDQRAIYELNEASALQAIAFAKGLGIAAENLNRSGGSIASGRPLGAASAATLVRLFSGLLGDGDSARDRYGVAATGALGGEGVAALFEALSP